MACQEIVSGYSISYFMKSPDSEMVTGPNFLILSIMFLATSIQLPHWYIHTSVHCDYTQIILSEKNKMTLCYEKYHFTELTVLNKFHG